MSNPSNVSDDKRFDPIEQEQQYVSMLYRRLDDLRERATTRLREVLGRSGGTLQAAFERDATTHMYQERLTRLGAVENGLCFGRLDLADGGRRYIGRIGIFGEAGGGPAGSAEPDGADDGEPLLIDWRAPAARAFYLATAASPHGVDRRRHIRLRQREVVGLDDEILDPAAARGTRHRGLIGEAALLAALDAGRTGRMSDIVATIQSEQDRVIRSPLGGVLVVAGGPGTGKTAVALHRAAYLLYAHRRQLAARGVLIVGPNATFLRYISQVLPSLAETGVLLRTPGELYPGVRADRAEPAEAAEIKGRAEMAGVLAAAVADRQWVPDEALEVGHEGESLRLERAVCAAARTRARESLLPHNQARAVFAEEIVTELTRQYAERLGADPFAEDPLGEDDAPGAGASLLDPADVVDIRRELAAAAAVRGALDRMWPVLTPRRLLAELFADPGRLASAAPGLTAAQRRLLLRDPAGEAPGGWTTADVPLLDELAELLGAAESPDDVRRAAARQAAERAERLAYAQGVLDVAEGSRTLEREGYAEDAGVLVTDLLDADQLAERHQDREYVPVARRAAADRGWAFGHVIVDEAQELSPMSWRLLMRRCPSRSMTLVGDLAQTGDLGGASSWQQMLGPHVGERWRLAELTVNYRTPAEIMTAAASLPAATDPSYRPPRSVRETGTRPWLLRVPPDLVAERLVATVREEAAALEDGRLGVIVPAGRAGDLGRAIRDAVPGAIAGDHPDLDRRVVVLTVRQAKGLEFDTVLVVDPDAIVAESPRGRSDLYVALTRATQRLGIVDPTAETGAGVAATLPALAVRAGSAG